MLHQHFFEHARLHPGRPALNIAGHGWSYAEVGALATDIARNIAAVAPPHANVAVLSSRSIVAYAAMLGVMAAGHTYVPLYRRASAERNLSVLDDAQCAGLIVDQESHAQAAQLLRACRRRLFVLLPDMQALPAQFQEPGAHRYLPLHAANHPPPKLPDSRADDDATRCAYIIYTSGSTGRPKGVPVRHESICACMESLHGLLQLRPDDRCTQFAELSFDFAIGEIFLCWRAGACLYVPSAHELVVPLGFAIRNGITVWSSVPTIANELRALRALKRNALPNLRVSYFCGEALPSSLAQAWAQAAPNSKIVNLYGPTEVAVFATFSCFDPTTPPAVSTVPIGAPLGTVGCTIIDEEGKVVPEADRIGELLLTGKQVAAGYWNNPVASAACFVRGTFGGEETRTWYRTGDLVSRHAVYGLLFQGRKDRQVKVRGYRLELQEVESEIARIIGCDQVVVIPLTLADGRCEALLALCPRLGLPEASLRRACMEALPPHMVPQRFVEVAQFPVNSNGKLDYLGLRRLVDDQGLLHLPAMGPHDPVGSSLE